MIEKKIVGTLADASAGGGAAVGSPVSLLNAGFLSKLIITVGANPTTFTIQESVDDGLTWTSLLAPMTLPSSAFTLLDIGASIAKKASDSAPDKQVRVFASALAVSAVAVSAIILEEELS